MVALVLLLIPRHEGGVRLAVALYLAATVASFVLPTPVGGNISRLGECLGIPLVACLLWPHRRLLLTALAIPLGVLQWTPAFATLPTVRRDPSAAVSYFKPLLGFLDAHRAPLGRVEIVPLRGHWEAAYAAPAVPLARGWERQLDSADNPIFYDQGALQPASYQAWLLDRGVRYVAVPDVALDYAGEAEAALINAGVPGLEPVWSDAHWRVLEVVGSHGIVEGPADLVRLSGEDVVLNVTGPGPVLVRVRFSSRWAVAVGHVSLHPAPGGWTAVDSCGIGEVRLRMQLRSADNDRCNPAATPDPKP
jgi:hypothetical protein